MASRSDAARSRYGLAACALAFAVAQPAGARAQETEDEPLVSDADMASDAAGDAAAEAPAESQKILVLPYQPIYRSAEPGKTKLATELVVKELAKQGGLQVFRGGVAREGAEEPSGDKIDKLLDAASEFEANKNVQAAIEARRQAIAEMEADPAAVGEAQDFIRAHHDLARALFWAGEDDEAKKVLDLAARMSPAFDLPAGEYSRFYRAAFTRVAKEAVTSKPAELLVRSALPGATIYLDGRNTAVAPVRLEEALPGKHLLQAEVEGVPTAAQVVTIQAGKNDEVTVSFGDTWGGVAVGAVADAIAENQLSADAVKKAVEAGKEAGVAFVVAGGMALDKVAAKFNVHTFVVNVATGGVMQLDVTNFDLDMLTAASDVIRIVRAVEASVKDFGDAKRAVASIESKVRPQSIINEVDAKPDFSIQTRTASRRPKRPSVRRPIKVLKGSGTLRIKDEED